MSLKNRKNLKVSIIYVLYKQIDDLLESIDSVINSKPKYSFEIIVVDNEGKNKNKKKILEVFPNVKYIKNKNSGYGAGNNFGVKHSNGEYLFILNPDTLIKSGAVDRLVKFLDKNKKAAVIAPNLLRPNGKLFDRIGSRELTPTRATFTLSFLSKLFPNNRFLKEYFLQDFSRKKLREADAVPGSAFMIKRKVFQQAGCFDENMFMFFEEHDLGKRIADLGYKTYILPTAEVIHKWKSSKTSKRLKKIFQQSRFYYFKKHYGLIKALLVESFLRVDKHDLLFLVTFGFGAFIRLHNGLAVNSFSGEIGDNLLDIKNYWQNGQIPLIGPPTSHSWLVFGPLFYWIYGPVLILSGFDPWSHSVFGAVMSILIVLANYIFITKLFNKKIALLSSFILAFSPFYIGWGHTGRFFTFVLLLIYPYIYYFSKSLVDKKRSLLTAGLIIGLMLNFHFTPLLIIPPTLLLLFIYRKGKFIRDNIVYFSGVAIANLPLLFHDALNGFSMSFKFVLWIPYRAAGFLGIYPKNNLSEFVFKDNLTSFYNYVANTFVQSSYFLELAVFILFIASTLYFFRKVRSKNNTNWIIVFTFLIFGYLGIFIHGSPPEHYYMPIVFIPALLVSAFTLSVKNKNLRYGLYVLILASTIVSTRHSSFLFRSHENPYELKYKVSEKIIIDAKGHKYELIRIGENDQFEGNFAQDYQYLLWWMGNEPVKVGDQIIVQISPKYRYIIIEDSHYETSLEKIISSGPIHVLKEEL